VQLEKLKDKKGIFVSKGASRMLWAIGGIVLILIFVLIWSLALDNWLLGKSDIIFGQLPESTGG
jgi:hypothetical protein